MSTELAEEQIAEDGLFAEVDEEDEKANMFLLFHLADEIYGVNIKHVTEIIEMQSITEVPDMPGFIKGVINLRGRVIPVMDLRLRLDMSERDYDDRTCVIIAQSEKTSMGVIVDTVAEVQSINNEEIEAAPEFNGDGKRENIVDGMGKMDDNVILLIDVHRLLTRRGIGDVVDSVEK